MISLTDCWLCTELRLEYRRILSRHWTGTIEAYGKYENEWVRCPKHAHEHEQSTLWAWLKEHELTLTPTDPSTSNRGNK